MDSLFFVLSKIYWLFGKPDTLMLILLTVVAIFVVIAAPHSKSVRFLSFVVLIAWFVAVLPLSSWLFGPLETRFPKPEFPAEEEIGGVVVLGGAEYIGRSDSQGSLQLNEMGERILEMNRLLHLYPNSQFIYTSGSGSALKQGKKGADYVKDYFAGIDMNDRIDYERESRNTFENALYSKKIMKNTDKPWLLVTSAFHMPRSVGIFSKQGIPVIPYPVDYWSTPAKIDSLYIGFADNFVSINMAAREWTGLTAYWLAGKTSSWFPSENDLLSREKVLSE